MKLQVTVFYQDTAAQFDFVIIKPLIYKILCSVCLTSLIQSRAKVYMPYFS